MDFTFHTFIGLIGAFGYLISYAFVQMRRDYAKTMDYSVINLLSAALVAFSLTRDFNLGSMFIQIMWIFISLYGVYRCMKYKLMEKNSLTNGEIKNLSNKKTA